MTAYGINGHTNGRRRTNTAAEVARMDRQIEREAAERAARKAAAAAASTASAPTISELVAAIKARRAPSSSDDPREICR